MRMLGLSAESAILSHHGWPGPSGRAPKAQEASPMTRILKQLRGAWEQLLVRFADPARWAGPPQLQKLERHLEVDHKAVVADVVEVAQPVDLLRVDHLVVVQLDLGVLILDVVVDPAGVDAGLERVRVRRVDKVRGQ